MKFFGLSIILTCGFVIASQPVLAALPVGKAPPALTLAGDDGGKVAGGDWSSSEIKGKVYVLFYVDPDESETNEHVSAALKKEAFGKDRFGSIAVINMAATWKPNFAINSVLKSKQKDYPDAIYIRDMKKSLVKKWQLADDSSDVMAFDKTGNVIFSKDGKLSDADLTQLIAAVRKSL